jgi:hypothetical protein
MVKLLRSILVFVMFITFHANLDEITEMTDSLFPCDRTLYTTKETDTSKLLSWGIYDVTGDLCALITHLEANMRLNRWFDVRRKDKELLAHFVLKPAESLNIQGDYVLELLGTFKQIQLVDKSIQYYTLIDYWMPGRRENCRHGRIGW